MTEQTTETADIVQPTRTLHRTAKFAVSFPGYRKADLMGKEGLFYKLAVAQGDLTRAANASMSALFLLRQGSIDWPLKPDGKKVSDRTLSYQLLSGKWQPFGKPAYEPKGREVGSNVFLGVAGSVYTRISTDYTEVIKGEKSLPTFRTLPIMVSSAGVSITPEGCFDLNVWSGRKNNRVKVAPVKVRGGQRAIINRLRDGTYKLGDAKLFKDKRKGKWMLAVSWSGAVEEAQGEKVAGIDLGISDTMKIAYIGVQDGKFDRYRDTINVPKSARAAARKVGDDKRDRLQFNRDVYALREGRGRERKLRPVTAVSDRHARITDTAIRQAAAAAIRAVQAQGVKTIVLEELATIGDRYITETDAKSKAKAARARRHRVLSWQPYKTRQYITQAAEKAGIAVIAVQPAYTSKMCASCGTIWTTTAAKTVAARLKLPVDEIEVVEPHDGFGRNGKTFRCSCGHEVDSDFNAAINIARRGLIG